MQEIFDTARACLPLLSEAIGFYFSAVGLVVLALIPTLGRLVGVVWPNRLLHMPTNILLEIVVFGGRAALVMGMLVVGKTFIADDLDSVDAWNMIYQITADYLLQEGGVVLIKVLVVGAIVAAVHMGLDYFISEYRVAKLLERMQRNVPAERARSGVLLVIQNMITIPITIAATLSILQLI